MTSTASAEIREPASGRSSGFVTTSPLPELDHLFRLFVLSWDLCGTSAQAPESTRALGLVGALLDRGARVAIVTDASLDALAPAIEAAIAEEPRKRLHVAANGGDHLFGFDHRGRPIEVVQTVDRGDVLSFMMHEIARPLGLAPEDVLVVGEAYGLAGLADILEQQLALEAELGPFAPPRDPSWVVVESGFDVAREHEIESLLTIANGYLGMRGSLAEGSSVSRPATFLAGAFEASSDVSPVPELVIAPDWGRLRFTVEGEPFGVETTSMERHHRTLDLRRGLLLREGLGTGPGGHATRIRTVHLASLANRHLLLEAVEISPHNFSGTVVVDAVLSGDVKSGSGSSHWAGFEPRHGLVGPILVGKTHGGLELALASRTTAADPGSLEMRCEREVGPVSAMERCTLHVRLGEPSVLHRVVGLFTSRDGTAPVQRVELLERQAAGTSFDALLADHVAAWQARWKQSDVEIDGAPGIERALRFALYHLIATVQPHDPRCSIGARALSGEAYRGHVFWDTEIFMVPFYVHTWPEAARTLLLYRHLTLDGARRKAKKLGFEGALYAWESADTGDETTPEFVRSPVGEIVPILSGLEEHHISADVAYAIWAYAQSTGDERILGEEGAEILIETARFWVSRGSVKVDGKFHIDRVIGPDEYHESVDDNAFTNWMARQNLRYAAAIARGVGSAKAAALGVTPEEIRHWEEIAARMYLGEDPRTGLIEQHKGFFGLEYVDVAAYSPRTVPIDVLLGRERTKHSQVVKQADVVQLLALLWDEFSPSARRENFLYYEPRTAHGSSLSPGIHALVAARLGLLETAARYLEQTASIDLGNNMGNAAGGVHAAGLGSLWQAVAFGVAGLRTAPEDPETLIVAPTLLPGMRRVSLPMQLRGRSLQVHALPGEVEVHVTSGTAPIGLTAPGKAGATHTVRAEPGRAYVARREEEGFLAWEEIEP
ncbi:glycoside hydrolase family 65 protein [Polyangium jinanense]|uniref:Glycoside hydrolase family 65 protein n=2 Tax=Polyangium jinanense TaxID=2829994 RepID=A0A9X4APF4_9BACT|nr:glycosyl hydrolase family 65 protein [Polyangium jinanense]MDC3952370.1 glycoside hydrolase family 65 protein [Polyangium jinanense]MDC3979999.1 glycoside hydrolase family 65 protein [Polyangium jinanense]